jgi:hypothetical protein
LKSTGRLLANPMSERTRGFESHPPRLTQGFIWALLTWRIVMMIFIEIFAIAR